MATQGCDQSADGGANDARRRKPPRRLSHSGSKAINPRGNGDRVPRVNHCLSEDPWISDFNSREDPQ